MRIEVYPCNVCGLDTPHHSLSSIRCHNKKVAENIRLLKNYQRLSADQQADVRARVREDEGLPETSSLDEVEQVVQRMQANIN